MVHVFVAFFGVCQNIVIVGVFVYCPLNLVCHLYHSSTFDTTVSRIDIFFDKDWLAYIHDALKINGMGGVEVIDSPPFLFLFKFVGIDFSKLLIPICQGSLYVFAEIIEVFFNINFLRSPVAVRFPSFEDCSGSVFDIVYISDEVPEVSVSLWHGLSFSLFTFAYYYSCF